MMIIKKKQLFEIIELLALHRSTWNSETVCKSFVLYKNT